ncbi:outer membrane beta-barrel protein [Winogradskyella sp. R77965]|uniref:outer membrane beta-barrel protein n=1 Tax=Winogradskyella sp. R77965 TaxID=3093872 RepID=UPI0037DD1889
MKKLILIVTLLTLSLSSFAQRNYDEWYLSVGLNSINSLGSRSPIFHPGDWAKRFPVSAAVEFNWSEKFGIEQSITFNGFTEDDEIDGADLKKDYNYISFDTHLKYYFGQYIFPNSDQIDLYANAGLGFFQIDETNISANLGGGIMYWVNRTRNFGIRAQVIGKFAFNHAESGLDNNHFQYHLQAVFRL